MEDIADDGDMKKLDEAERGIKLQEDNGDNALQGLANDDNDNQDKVGLTVCLKTTSDFILKFVLTIVLFNPQGELQ